MANRMYGSWLENMMDVYFKVEDHWTADPVGLFVVLVTDGYTFDTNHHEVGDLGIHVITDPIQLTEVTTTLGVLAAADSETEIEESGGVGHAAVMFIANDDGSQLIAYMDEGQPAQFPIILTSGKLNLRWSPPGILRI